MVVYFLDEPLTSEMKFKPIFSGYIGQEIFSMAEYRYFWLGGGLLGLFLPPYFLFPHVSGARLVGVTHQVLIGVTLPISLFCQPPCG